MPLLAPPSSTIKLSTASTVVQTNGTTEIRATVLEPSGTPVHNGTTVTFTTNLGTVSPVDARTLNGVATVQFLGNGQSGKAQVRAISGGAASDPLELSVGAAAAGRVVVTANPNQVAPGSPSIITATVTDANSNPLSGVLVSFSTDNGSLSSSISSTSSNGQAQTTLITSRDAIVTATVGTGTATTPGTVKVTVATVPEIGITTSTTSPTEGQPVTFAIAVTGTGSTESFQSIVVDFGDGTNSGVLSGGSQSVAHTYARPGTYVVEATGTSPSGNTKRATTTVSVADRGIVDVRITRSPDVVTQDDPVTFTAAVTGGGTVRSYNWNFGDGRTFNGSSQVSHTYSSTGPRTVTVTVSTTDGNTGRGQTQFVVQP
jgi:hypothetical protein